MRSMSEVVQILAGQAIFADLAPGQLEAIAHTFDEEWFNVGQRILRQGFSGSNFYVILNGEAAVVMEGTERARLARGDFFGEISVLLREPPAADVVAMQALHCLVIPGPELERFLLSNPRVMFRILQTEARRLHNTLQWQS